MHKSKLHKIEPKIIPVGKGFLLISNLGKVFVFGDVFPNKNYQYPIMLDTVFGRFIPPIVDAFEFNHAVFYLTYKGKILFHANDANRKLRLLNETVPEIQGCKITRMFRYKQVDTKGIFICYQDNKQKNWSGLIICNNDGYFKLTEVVADDKGIEKVIFFADLKEEREDYRYKAILYEEGTVEFFLRNVKVCERKKVIDIGEEKNGYRILYEKSRCGPPAHSRAFCEKQGIRNLMGHHLAYPTIRMQYIGNFAALYLYKGKIHLEYLVRKRTRSFTEVMPMLFSEKILAFALNKKQALFLGKSGCLYALDISQCNKKNVSELGQAEPKKLRFCSKTTMWGSTESKKLSNGNGLHDLVIKCI